VVGQCDEGALVTLVQRYVGWWDPADRPMPRLFLSVAVKGSAAAKGYFDCSMSGFHRLDDLLFATQIVKMNTRAAI